MSRWADYSSDEAEDDEEGFVTVGRPRKRVEEDVIFLFSDAVDWDHPNYRDTVRGERRLKEAVRANRKLYRWWHGYCPARKQVLVPTEDRSRIRAMDADEAYMTRIRHAVPDHVWCRHVR